MNPLRPLPGYAAYAIAIVLKPLLTGELPKLLQTITYWDFMLYPDALRLNIADQDNRPIYDYLTWKSFLKSAFAPPPRPKRSLYTSCPTSARPRSSGVAGSLKPAAKSGRNWNPSPAPPPPGTRPRRRLCPLWLTASC